jgi:glycosyltransferase involved in cell wall biosynthesis
LTSCSLIIATYNRPDALCLCLKSVCEQSVVPAQVIIADDGSTEETAEVVNEFKRIAAIEVKHIWHPDEGFRLAAIRNKAIAEVSSAYVIQIDGDLILHPQFVADHLALKKEG